jgi:hypothetical protein
MDWIQGLLGTDDVTRVLQENDRFRGRRPTMRSRGRATADPGGPLLESGQDVVSSLPDSQANLRVTRCESPDDFQGFGRTGVCAEVAAAQPFASALVRFKLQQEQTSHLHPGWIAVARWDKVAER